MLDSWTSVSQTVTLFGIYNSNQANMRSVKVGTNPIWLVSLWYRKLGHGQEHLHGAHRVMWRQRPGQCRASLYKRGHGAANKLPPGEACSRRPLNASRRGQDIVRHLSTSRDTGLPRNHPREGGVQQTPLTASRRDQPWQHPDLRWPASKTVRRYISVV